MDPFIVEQMESYAAADQRCAATASHHARELRDVRLYTAASVCADTATRFYESARYWLDRAQGGES